MKAGKLFYIGAVVTIVGLVLMSIPDRECVDCEDEAVEIGGDLAEEIVSFVEEAGND